MTANEYERLRNNQKTGLLSAVGGLVLWLGLGVWAGLSNWLWAVPFCAFFAYMFLATFLLTYKFRKKGSPFVPSRREVFKRMFTFKMDNEQLKITRPDIKEMQSGEKQTTQVTELYKPKHGDKVEANDPCPCGSGKNTNIAVVNHNDLYLLNI